MTYTGVALELGIKITQPHLHKLNLPQVIIQLGSTAAVTRNKPQYTREIKYPRMLHYCVFNWLGYLAEL